MLYGHTANGGTIYLVSISDYPIEMFAATNDVACEFSRRIIDVEAGADFDVTLCEVRHVLARWVAQLTAMAHFEDMADLLFR